MRSTRDLIAKLHMEAADADIVVLAVGFPTETKFVSSDLDDAKALELLNNLCKCGGIPLGFIRSISNAGTQTRFQGRPLAEHGDDPVVLRVLREICERMADTLVRQYGGSVKRKDDEKE